MVSYAELSPLLKYSSKISNNTFCRGRASRGKAGTQSWRNILKEKAAPVKNLKIKQNRYKLALDILTIACHSEYRADSSGIKRTGGGARQSA